MSFSCLWTASVFEMCHTTKMTVPSYFVIGFEWKLYFSHHNYAHQCNKIPKSDSEMVDKLNQES